MELQKDMGNEKLPSIINDPFRKNKVVTISTYSYQTYSGNWNFTGKVEFSNGNTKGEQKFEGENFDHVVLKIKALLEELQ